MRIAVGKFVGDPRDGKRELETCSLHCLLHRPASIANPEIVLPLTEVQKLVAYIPSYLSPTRQDVAQMTGLFTVN